MSETTAPEQPTSSGTNWYEASRRREKELKAHWEATYGPYPPKDEMRGSGYPLQCWLCSGMFVHGDGLDKPEKVQVATNFIAEQEADYFFCEPHYKARKEAARKQWQEYMQSAFDEAFKAPHHFTYPAEVYAISRMAYPELESARDAFKGLSGQNDLREGHIAYVCYSEDWDDNYPDDECWRLIPIERIKRRKDGEIRSRYFPVWVLDISGGFARSTDH